MNTKRIFGPPGTGKTATLTAIASQAAEDIGPGAVMICSYTNAAAEEIASRAPTIPENQVGTIHKAAYELIGRPPILESKPASVKLWNAYAPEYSLSLPQSKDMGSGLEYGDSQTQGDEIHALVTILRNRMIPVEKWPSRARAYAEAWNRWKAVEGGIDFTDMLEAALESSQAAPGKPRLILVDEAQDCTALQMSVVKHWAAAADNLILCGDDDQCIYQFAGATPEAFAGGDLTDDDIVLEQSHRLPFNVWEYAVTWISKVPKRIPKDFLPRQSADPGFISRAPFTFQDALGILRALDKIIDRGMTAMVIASCSYMVDPIKNALRDKGIPFHNPYRMIRADWNPLRLTQGTTYAERVSSFLSVRTKDKAWWTPTQLKAAASVLQAKGVFRHGMKSKLEEITHVNLDVLFSLFEDDAANAILACDLDWWEANLVNNAARAKAAYPLTIARTRGADFLDARAIPPEIVIGTIHSVKGGEADVVIVFPDLSPQGLHQWSGIHRDSIQRLMYVAVTRARQGVIIGQPASSSTCKM